MELKDLQKKKLPDAPGVYQFRDADGNILYIGKATSLKDRVRSYFDPDLAEGRGPHIAHMVSIADTVTYNKTESVLEALLLEANQIKKERPPYNTDQKDDKSFQFVVITKEDFPRVLFVRGKDLFDPRQKGKNVPEHIAYTFGPFPKGGALKEALKIIRKIFPYRDKCTPCSEQKGECLPAPSGARQAGKPCFNRQIGLCPGVCSGEITSAEYKKQIQNIRMLFEGKKKQVVKQLEKRMNEAARAQEFEKAQSIKQQLFALEHIQDVALIKDEGLKAPQGIRIEGYDIAHTSGTNAVGVMTVVQDSVPETSEYRTFHIKSFQGTDDTRALSEVLERRLGHPEWQLPRMIVVDGGKAQKNAAERVLRDAGVSIPVIAVTKDERHKPKAILGKADLRKTYEKEILRVNQEAHRFAVSFHRKTRKKGFTK